MTGPDGSLVSLGTERDCGAWSSPGATMGFVRWELVPRSVPGGFYSHLGRLSRLVFDLGVGADAGVRRRLALTR